jgi:hypothetical protein
MRYKLQIVFVGVLAALAAVAFLPVADAQQAPPNPTADKAASASPTPPPVEDDEIIKIDAEVVNVLFTAQDNNRRLLTNLRQEDIRILENDQPQEITTFSRQVDLPLSLAILIDTSASQERTLPEEKAAAISFLETVIRPAKDEVCVISFTGEE